MRKSDTSAVASPRFLTNPGTGMKDFAVPDPHGAPTTAASLEASLPPSGGARLTPAPGRSGPAGPRRGAVPLEGPTRPRAAPRRARGRGRAAPFPQAAPPLRCPWCEARKGFRRRARARAGRGAVPGDRRARSGPAPPPGALLRTGGGGARRGAGRGGRARPEAPPGPPLAAARDRVLTAARSRARTAVTWARPLARRVPPPRRRRPLRTGCSPGWGRRRDNRAASAASPDPAAGRGAS